MYHLYRAAIFTTHVSRSIYGILVQMQSVFGTKIKMYEVS